MADAKNRPGTPGAEYMGDRAREYDHRMEVMFRTFGLDESAVREEMVGLLHLKPGARVLETGCGTGRDTVHLAQLAGELFATDLSADMIDICRARIARTGKRAAVRLMVADALALPFPDGYFDAAFHFGGINQFADIPRGISEMTRVVKPGGRVVFGDEGLGPWLADSEFGRILNISNPLYRHRAPIEELPVSARDVTCRWVINGSSFVIDFTVGTGEPFLDLDVEFPGWRGGSHRTRAYGGLDGVAPELRQRVVDAAAKEGMSLTNWLEKTLRRALPEK